MTWYVHRNTDGSLASAHRDLMPGYNDEALADTDPAIVAFLNPPPTLGQQIAPTDVDMPRACEDLIVTLLTKGVVAKADLPAPVVTHVNQRRAIRGQPPI